MVTHALRATGATTCSVRAWTRRLLFASVCFRLVLNLSWQTEPVLANRRFALWYERSQQMLLVLQSAAGVLRFINQVRERPTFSTKPRISTRFRDEMRRYIPRQAQDKCKEISRFLLRRVVENRRGSLRLRPMAPTVWKTPLFF